MNSTASFLPSVLNADGTAPSWLFPTLLGLLTTSYLVFLTKGKKNSLSSLPLPPGPKPVPVLGNALDLPKEQEWLTYEKWGKVCTPSAVHRPFYTVIDGGGICRNTAPLYMSRPSDSRLSLSTPKRWLWTSSTRNPQSTPIDLTSLWAASWSVGTIVLFLHPTANGLGI